MTRVRAIARTLPWLAVFLLQAAYSSAPQQIHRLNAVPANSDGKVSTSAEGGSNGKASIFFAKDGHFYTAGYVAYLAGYHDVEKIQNISCFTQTPDQEFWRLNAVPVSVYGITPGFWF